MTTLIPKYDLKDGGATPTGAINRPINEKLAETVSVMDFGAIGDGTTDDTTAINNALAASSNVIVPVGAYLISSTINVPAHTKLSFQGGLGNTSGSTPTAYFIKKSTMTTVGITVSECGVIEGGGLVNQVGNTSDGIQIIGNGAKLANVFVSRAGGVGVRVGTSGVYANTNSFELNHVNAIDNGSHGIYVHDGVSVGPADANAGTLFQCVAIGNGGDGIRLGHAFWVSVINCLSEINTGYGLYLSGVNNDSYPECRWANVVGGDYNEGNTAGVVYDASYFSTFIVSDSLSIPTTASTGLQGSALRNVISSTVNSLQGLTVDNFPFIVNSETSSGVTYSSIIKKITTGSNGDGAGLKWSISDGSGYVDAASIGVIQATTNQYSMVLNTYKSGNYPFLVLNPNANAVYPAIDNSLALGTASFRYTTVFATTGTINTSDANQKTDIVDISDVEKRVAIKLKSSMKRFKFKNGKRYHFGTIAQDVKAAFESEGLVAEEYGVFCSDVLEDGTVQLGIRYDELFAFIISAL